jgi:hypothetical protein
VNELESSDIPLLEKEGWTRNQENGSVPKQRVGAVALALRARLRHFGGFATFY